MALRDKLRQVINAALDGPAIKDISIKGHEFNVDRVKRTETADGKIIIDGKGDGDNISHRRTIAKDDQVDYGFTVIINETDRMLDDVSMSIKKGGLWKTFGVPIIAVIKMWDEISCLWDDETEIEDCEFEKIFTALYRAVKLDSKDFETGDLDDVDLDALESDDMSWEEVAELMVLSVMSDVVGRQIARVKPSWIDGVGGIINLAPDFGENQVTIGIKDEAPVIGGVNIDNVGNAGNTPPVGSTN